MIESWIVPERTDGLVPGLGLLFARKLRRLERHPVGDGQDASASALAEISADDLRQGSTVADEQWNRVDHRFRRDPAKRLFPHRWHRQYARQGEVVRRSWHGRRGHDLWVPAEIDSWNGVQRTAAVAGLHDQDWDVRSPGSEHVGEARKQQQAFVTRRIDE